MGEKFLHNNSSGNACYAGRRRVTHLFTPKVLHKHWDNCNTHKKLRH